MGDTLGQRGGGLLESGRILVAFSNASVCLLFTWLGIVVAKVP
ncbi:MAG: hypothetical protein M0023_13645 [Desulfobacteraceae bacterium]|nr:hypothetical protein [Desulfobacteraceae bacterium]